METLRRDEWEAAARERRGKTIDTGLKVRTLLG